MRYSFFCIWLLICSCMVQADAQCKWVNVRKVVDGDTLKLQDGNWVRCASIDTPEIDHQNNRAEPLGYEARDFLKQKVMGKTICLITGKQDRDRYGRMVAYLFDEHGKLINESIVSQGLAYFYPHADEIKEYSDKLLAAQHQAMRERLGIWRNRLETKGSFIGNRRSKRFHLKQCPSARRIKQKNRRAFASIWDAYWVGYAPASDCF